MRTLATKPRGWDAAVAAAILLLAGALALLLFLPRVSAPVSVQIYQNGALLYELPLNVDTELVIGGDYENTVTIHDGTVAVTHATCPGEDCVHTGPQSRAGRSIVCLPNRIEIRLVGEADVDIVVH